ncbi:MAG: PAS domain S-box protein [Sideroxyarcus sp.]|nr:PAS domain S-box protein [Sideroxyarcus sp.]
MNGLQQPKDSLFIAYWLIFGVIASLLGGFLAWNVYQEHSHFDIMERERLSVRARIADESMARQVDSIGRMLSGLRNDLRRWEKLGDGMYRASRRMAAMVDVITSVGFVAMLDAQGKIVATSHKEFIGQDFSYRDYFQAPLRNPDPDMLYVSPPFKNVSGILTMSLSRAIIAPDGSFAGVVMASLEPEEFRMLMNSVRYAPDMQASLMHGDGMVFMAIPEREGSSGKDMASSPDSFFNRHIGSQQIASVMSGRVSATGEERLTALRTSQPAMQRMSKPVVVAVSRDLSAIFAGWRQKVWLQGGLFGVLVLVAGAGLFFYQRRQRSYSLLVASYEAEQQKAAERLKLATEAAGMGVWEYDLVSEKLYWDDSMFTIYGEERGGFSADYAAWWGKLMPEDAAEVEAAVEATLEQGKPYDICFRIRRGDGQVRTLHALAQVHFDASGQPVRVIGTNQDVTERKQAEQALAESESRFREIFNTVSDAIFIHDAETGRIVDVNRRMCEMYGFTHEEALACGVNDLSAGVPPYSSAEAAEKIRLAHSEGPQTFDWLARARDGRFFWVEVSLRFASIGSQQRILAVVRDISERKHVEEELRIAGIAFESQDGIVVTNADHMILRVNRAFSEMTGYTEDEVLGHTPDILKSDRHDEAFYAAMWESVRHDGSWHGEIWNRRKNGEVYPEQLTLTAIKGGNGEITHYVAMMRDITERKAAEEEIFHLAFYDALTKLPNRRLLDDRIRQAMAASKRSGLYGALMFLDLDNFKPLNDTHGHDVGDLLLVEAARRIASCVREADTVARFGGDEFVVVLGELDAGKAESAKQAGIVAEKIRAILSEPYRLSFKHNGTAEMSVEHHCAASIGVALFFNHEAGPEDILKWADMAMYQAKEGGRNRVNFYGS